MRGRFEGQRRALRRIVGNVSLLVGNVARRLDVRIQELLIRLHNGLLPAEGGDEGG